MPKPPARSPKKTGRTIFMPLPLQDFDPTEAAIPWQILSLAGFDVRVATPTGERATPDQRMLLGAGLGPWARLLRATPHAVAAYEAMASAPEFRAPLRYDDLDVTRAAGLILPGGHAPGMRPYLESSVLATLVAAFFAVDKPVGAICHGVVLAARSKRPDGLSVLHGRRTTALLKTQELAAWAITCPWLGTYYRTYPQSVEAEVLASLASPEDFERGPMPLRRDRPGDLSAGFAVKDGRYVSARWPGDAHRFAATFLGIL
jgi:protease I